MDDSTDISISSSAVQASASTGTVPFHKHGGADGPLIPFQNISGNFPMVTTTPTLLPNGGAQSGIALSSVAGQIYYFDFTNKVWQVTAASNTVSNASVYGDGSDGVVTLDGSNTYSFLTKSGNTYTCKRDTYFSNVTISTGVTLKNGGFFIFINGTLTRAGTGVIDNSGGDGGAGVIGDSNAAGSGGNGGAAGVAGIAAASGTLPITLPGKIGRVGGNGGSTGSGGNTGANGTTGADTTNSLGSAPTAAGDGGTGGGSAFSGGAQGLKGTAGNTTVGFGSIRDVFQARTVADFVSTTYTQFQGSASGASGGSGGGGSGDNAGNGGAGGGGSGASGAPGGFLVVFVKNIVAANTNALFQAKGGKGGNGGPGGSSSGGNSGGGAGAGAGAVGNGGIACVVYNTTDQTITSLINAAAGAIGTGGAAGLASGVGNPGTAGSNSAAGTAGLAIPLLM